MRIVHSMAPNALPTTRRIARYLCAQLGVGAQVIENMPWQASENLLWQGKAQIGYICGLTYVRRRDAGVPLELLAAPVMADERYGDRPVYLSEVLVRRESRIRSFADLRGATWAYNEPGSHSGYNIMRARLAGVLGPEGFFGRVIEAGSHQAAIALLASGRADVSAIDTTVLATELRQRPGLADRFRVIETLGPSPIPPLVVHRDVDPKLKRELGQTLSTMHQDPRGRRLLALCGISRFEAVDDAYYDAIRQSDRVASSVRIVTQAATRPSDYRVG